MSSSTDSRIVTMKFDNAQFERGVQKTTESLGKLNQSLQMQGATKGMEHIQEAAGKFNFGTLEGGITHISAAFVAMSTVAITALTNITNKAVDTGIRLAKSLTIDPIKAGFDEYELKLGSIQTILANTQKYGTTLGDVTKSLDDLNSYADKTIYNFGDMTKNIGLFTNAGIKIEDATSMIKGFSNSAAASGTSAEGAAGAAYQLSQALSNGTIRLMDWKSLTNVGMGNKNMQDGIIGIAEAMGTFSGSGTNAAEATAHFNESLEKGWLSADVMSNYLQIMAGDMDTAEMKALGLSDSMISTLQQQQKTAEDAATKVRTFTQLLGTLREAVGSGWSRTFETVIGNFDEATELWTGVSGAIGGFIQASADARNKVLDDWKALGGRQFLIAGLKNIFEGLMSVVKPIKDAFREIFPRKTGEELMRLTASFAAFTNKLKLGEESMENLKRTFKGVFAIFSIIWQVVKGVVGVFGDLFSATATGGGGFLEFTGSLGDIFVKIDEWLKSGDRLKNFFEVLGKVLKTPIELISILIGFIGDIFDKFNVSNAEKVTDSITDVSDALSPLDVLIERVKGAFGALGTVLEKVWEKLQPFLHAIGGAISDVWDAIKGAFSSGNFSGVLDVINTGLLGGLVLIIKKFLDNSIFGSKGSISGFFNSVKGAFENLTGTLKAMQQQVKAETLMKIAIAVGILTISIVALSLIDSDKLAKALTAIAFAFGELLVAMKIMEKIGNSKGFYKMPVIAVALILFAAAVLVLTFAIKRLSELSWSELAKGMIGLGAILFVLSKAIKPISDNAKDMIKASVGILVLSVALRVLANVVKTFGEMDWGTIGKGLVGMGGALVVIAGAMKLMPKNMASQAASLLLISISVKALASALGDFGAMDWSTIGKGLVGMAGALLIVAGAMQLMPKNMLLTAAGLVVVGIALKIIADAVASMGEMGWDEIARGLVTLAGAMAIIAIGLYAMTGTLAGSAALLVAAVALKIMAGVLKTLGSMSVGNIVKGLLALAGVFLVLGVAGYLLTPVVPVLLGLGVAVGLIGAAMLMAGLGVLAFVTAIMILVALGAAAGAALGLLIDTIISKIPGLFAAFAQGIVDFLSVIASSGPQIATAFTTVLESLATAVTEAAPEIGEAITTMLTTLCQTIIETAPKFGEAFKTVVRTFLDVVVELTPDIVQAGYDVLLAIIRGVADNIADIVDAAVDVVVNFVNALGSEKNVKKIVDAGANFIVNVLNGLAQGIRDHSEDIRQAGVNVASALIEGITGGLVSQSALSKLGTAAKKAATAVLGPLGAALVIASPSKKTMEMGKYVAEGLALGIEQNTDLVRKSTITMGDSVLNPMKTTMEQLADLVAKEVALDPTITPRIDLTQAQQDAARLRGLIQDSAIAPTTSYSQASTISEMQDNGQGLTSTEVAQPVSAITFEQNNYSPKALSSVEIYRQTKNQLSLAKEALNV